MAVVEAIAEHPEVVALLSVVIAVAMQWQRTLSYPEYRAWHRFKVVTFPWLHRVTPLFVSKKNYREDSAEFMQTWDKGLREAWTEMQAMGGSPHLINSIKSREDSDGNIMYSDMHFSWGHDSRQTEIYMFSNGDGTVDVYGHNEDSPEQPLEHLDTSNQKAGDPENVLGQ